MIDIKYLIAAILSIMIAGCSSNKGIINDNNLKKINISAHHKLHDSHYTMKDLEIMYNSYDFGPYAQQIQLDLIYAYYKLLNFTLAKVVIDRFLRFNPTHLNVDYVLYMRGITNMALDDNAMQRFFGVDRSDRNPEHARAAFYDFMQLIRVYPSSQYTRDASLRLIYLKNRLARYELSVVKYYHKRNAYVAVANRVEQMLHNFPDTQATRHALPYMEKAYRKLHLNGQADKVAKIIAENTELNVGNI